MSKQKIGWEEWVSLPDLNLPALLSKIDTGASTSAIHAFNIQPFGSENNPKVRFGINPIPGNDQFTVYCSASVVDVRNITSSNGISEIRYVVETKINIGGISKKIEITLTNRENMKYKMLLGKSALDGFSIQTEKSFLHSILSYDLYKKSKIKESIRRSLRIGVLTLEPKNYSNKKFVIEAEKSDHVCELINTKRCYLNIQSHKPEVHYNNKALPYYDVIIPRIGASVTFYGMSVVRQFEAMGTFCLNSSESIGLSRDKLAAHQILSRHRIPMPTTAFANSPNDSESLIKLASGAPLVVKLLESTQGKGVVLAETQKAASGVIRAFQKLNAPFIVQEFVKEAEGCDIRCIVLGNKVIASMMRMSSENDFRSNLHAGGSAKKIVITNEERKIALKAAKALGLNFAGVDLVRTNDGPKVLEVNSSPGLEGIEKISNINIAQELIKFLERKAGPAKFKN